MNSVWKFNMEYLSFRILQTYKDQENMMVAHKSQNNY